jgi:hypothetical protein
MFTYLILDALPKVPQNFVDLALDLAAKGKEDNYTQDRFHRQSYSDRKLIRNGEIKNTKVGYGHFLGKDWESWVRSNIIPEFQDTGVRVAVGENTDLHGPHCDAPMKWKFWYLLDTGGDQATTQFYLEKNHQAVRLGSDGPDTILFQNDYSKLELIEEVKLPLHTWLLFNTTVLHGVVGVTGPRTYLTVNVDPESIKFKHIF